jgi:hypothetical protein
VVRSLELQRIDSDVGLPIGQKAPIEAATTTKIEDPPLRVDESKEAALKLGALSLLFCEIPAVESIEQQQFLTP